MKDGFGDICDCMPYDPEINPGEEEICDGIDNDCTYLIDDYLDPVIGIHVELFNPCFGYGECGEGIVECNPNDDMVDCSTNPGGTMDQSSLEVCDGQFGGFDN
jgi:hypothetical protein